MVEWLHHFSVVIVHAGLTGSPDMLLNICYHIAPKTPTVQASMVCDHFGLTLDGQQQVIARDLELPVTSGNLIAFIGPSGSGKSSLMRAVAAELNSSGYGEVLWLDHLPQVSSLVADALALPPLDAFRLLAQCGLAEPQLLLRTPDELSDGQRFRFRLAQSVAESLRRQSQRASQGTWIVADEFTSPLDRTLAKVIARNWHSLLRQHRLGGLVATTHTDILDDLEPDLIVTCSHDAPPQLSGPAASPTFSSATWSAQQTLPEADAPTPAVKKRNQLLPRAGPHHRNETRLGVFCSVALPLALRRHRPLRHDSLASPRTDRHLCLHQCPTLFAFAEPALWSFRPLDKNRPPGHRSAVLPIGPCGDSSHLSRSRAGGSFCSRQLPACSLALDRIARRDGAVPPLL